ncbi:hypothetical protein [Methylorubrum suomiense]|uniref:Uncharacterized protein n=1 Tax=Methylorubrum suomiense TaxID=144191 RepID=A0ABQ4V151_9HYPH|nr:MULTISPECIES: hypothetical protein [Methylobacteriaceae]GJE77824.1 hypothetical protein BGCPKDLD_4431 [Methylorubrum suomiense]
MTGKPNTPRHSSATTWWGAGTTGRSIAIVVAAIRPLSGASPARISASEAPDQFATSATRVQAAKIASTTLATGPARPGSAARRLRVADG